MDVERIVDPTSRQDRPVKLIAISDIRVAKSLFPTLSISEFLDQKYRKCGSCGATILRDWGDEDSSGICHECQADFNSSEDTLDS